MSKIHIHPSHNIVLCYIQSLIKLFVVFKCESDILKLQNVVDMSTFVYHEKSSNFKKKKITFPWTNKITLTNNAKSNKIVVFKKFYGF